MSSRSAWKILGIEPTEDKRAIKRAYAAKLKATDVEGDPRAFIELREALETATWEADYLQYREHSDEPEDAPEPVAVAAELEPIRDEELAITEPDIEPDDEDENPTYWRWEPERQPETEGDQERIVQLLWGEEPVAEIEVELAERTHRILTAPEMEQIDHASGIEDWMASIIAQSIPRSDTMARIAVPHFGWEDDADDWRQRYGVAAAAARLRDLGALDRLSKPDHRWHQAYQLLRQPPPDALGWKTVAKHKTEILALLESIRHHTPALEHELNAEHVATWDPALAADSGTAKTKSGWGFRWWWWVLIGLWGFVQLTRALGDVAPPPSAPAPEGQYSRWRAEQLPPVQKWMDDNPGEIDRLFAEQKSRGGGMPTCSALDAIAPLTKAQFDHCAEAEEARQQGELPVASASSAPNSAPQQVITRLVLSSPMWRSEQAPSVRRWMDNHPEMIDRMLQPHLTIGGLPSCTVLGAAAKMSAGELAICRKAESARVNARAALRAAGRDLPIVPGELVSRSEPLETNELAVPGDICDRPEMAEQPVCQDNSANGPQPAQ